MNRSDFLALADLRIEEAKVLLDQQKWDGAYYLAGYSVECMLKAGIAKLTREHDFPATRNYSVDCYTHDLERLLTLAGLEPAWIAECGTDAILDKYWDIVLAWSESSRYERKSQLEAESMYNAIIDSVHGVLPWLRKHC